MRSKFFLESGSLGETIGGNLGTDPMFGRK